ncbi:hypothetical protein [Arthrobacter sp. NPDC058127]|uniref:hypothetical protein n=1 Tax=Arthrobacter sp. NPDC058127 TaxID=3346351 RepID=UPI0036E20535
MRRLLAIITAIAVLVGVLAGMNWDKLAPAIGPVLGLQSTAAPTAGTGPMPVGSQISGVQPTAAPTAIVVPTPQQHFRYALIDPTTSTDKSFRESMKADIIAAVRSYVPPKPPDPKVGVPSVTGLQLTVRLVATNSLAYGQQSVAVSIPSVPGLPERPDMTVTGALDPGGPYDTWKKSNAEWSTAYDAATAAAASATQTLGALNLNVDEWSGITAGAAALTLLAPAQGDVQFAVLSDLDENRPPQPANFNGHPILVVQPDPVGDIGRWDSLFNQFSSWASKSGSGTITRVRPENAMPAIATFITGK